MVRATADAVSSRVAAALNAGSTTPAEVIKLPKQLVEQFGGLEALRWRYRGRVRRRIYRRGRAAA
jgi:hypothetical protein